MKITVKVEGFYDEPPFEFEFTEKMVEDYPMIAFKTGELWGMHDEASKK